FFQAEDGIRDRNVTGVQTCALPILASILASSSFKLAFLRAFLIRSFISLAAALVKVKINNLEISPPFCSFLITLSVKTAVFPEQIGRASCRERVKDSDRGGR